MRTKYTKELLQPVVKKSLSVAQVLKHLGLQRTGGNHSHISKVIKKFELNISHFKGQGHMKGKTALNKRPIQDYLDNKQFIQSDKLKKRLIKEGYFSCKCYNCNNTQWLKKPIPLELHHIDCNHENNNLNNLTILCPNCHTLAHKA